MAKTARDAAIRWLSDDLRTFPNLSPEPASMPLSEPDHRLAASIRLTCHQRYLTLVYLLDQFLVLPFRKHTRKMQAAMLAGACQLIFMDSIPAHAAVHETIAWIKRHVSIKASRLANAVLRRLAELEAKRTEEAWQPAQDRLPLMQGSILLSAPVLPDIDDDLERHLCVSCSAGLPLVKRFMSLFDGEVVEKLLVHSLQVPPTILACGKRCDELMHQYDSLQPHHEAGFALFKGRQSQLLAVLQDEPDLRVQDVTSAHALAVLDMENTPFEPARILDLCAGRGTKTKQLLQRFPHARIDAYEPDAGRVASLRELTSLHDRLRIVEDFSEPTSRGESYDLILADVPCSNTGVLARRPFAKYRFDDRTLASVKELQMQIARQALAKLKPDGRLIYATCSIEPEENEQQVQKLLKHHPQAKLLHQQSSLPEGTGSTYHDGGYAALISLSE